MRTKQMIEKEYYTLKEITKIIDVPESTAHHWKETFFSWLPIKGEGRKKRYHHDSIEIFLCIQELYNKNTDTEAIKDLLTQKYPLTTTVNQKDNNTTITPLARIPAQLPEMRIPALENFTEKIESMFSQGIELLKETLNENRELRNKIESLEKTVMEMKDKKIKPDMQKKPRKTTAKPLLKKTNQTKKEIQKKIKAMRDNGKSWNQIADDFNQEGLKNPNTGKTWERKAVQRIFEKKLN